MQGNDPHLLRFPSQKPAWELWAGLGLMLIWNIFCWRFPFFWDNVLNSRIAHWYLESGFSSIIVPEQLDAGHPPFFSLYLALVWKIFGRSLAISHAAMLPLLFTVLWQFWRLASRILDRKALPWAVLFLFCEPTFLAQSSMVNPDIALVAFYLLCLNLLLDGKRLLAGLAMILMASMSFRGILMVGAVGLSDLMIGWISGHRKLNLRAVVAYLPVGILSLAWLFWHWKAQGWLFSPPPETYGGHREILGWKGIFKNLAVMLWRWLDYGRLLLWAWLGLGMVWIGFAKIKSDPKLKLILALLISILGTMAILLLPFSNPIGHRYFQIGFLLLGIAGIYLVQQTNWQKISRIALAIVLASLISGHFWIYPDKIAQGWDASLAHLGYFQAKKSMDAYLEQSNIPTEKVCGDFPLLSDPYFCEILPQQSPYLIQNYLEAKKTECKWLLVSNMNNGFSDEEWLEFKEGRAWEEVKRFESGQIYIQLLHSKN